MANHTRRHPAKLDAEGNKIKKEWPKVIEGIKFGSPLEYYTYQQFEENGIEFQKKFVFINPFRYGGEAVSGLSLTVDFYLYRRDIIVDPKGLQDTANIIKWKMLKRMLLTKGREPRIVFLSSQRAVREFVYMLANGFTQNVEQRALNGRVSKLKKVAKLIDGNFHNTADIVCSMAALSEMTDFDFARILTKLQTEKK
jgi:hypothetical protein